MNRIFLVTMLPALLLPLSAAGATETLKDVPAFFSGERLFEICSLPNYGQCSMYVAGVIDGIFHADGEGGRQRLCRTGITNQGAAELVLNRLASDEALRGLSAAAAVQAAVADRLSCASEQMVAANS
ncbi:Rap1a/Tai family immunity protein [Sphingobium baderi]|uniref:Rap1a/Tai family immunity protein n=1 Tax=Sphingobium baderi TaxID=1332080 RepID=UPI002B409E1B|nr:Rap1a/Tai family immunity protein [Sphingobium baderi]WRD78787.1 Rap1a/Tai family immunity protein [Sphingobium baderi]